MTPSNNSKIMVGLSGGVDSAVAALLLKEQGFSVEALFMKNWEEDDDQQYCAAAEDIKMAEVVCERLGISLHKANFSAQYWQQVFQHFLSEYEAGRTPNPDILCNSEIKFKIFPRYAKQFDADFIATGHYAQRHESNGITYLARGKDPGKDQSYFLHSLNQSQLKQNLFPIGNMVKCQVRELAQKAGLPNFARQDSTGICFIGERKFQEFLMQYLPSKPGPICTSTGKTIGEHQGVFFFTLGQRKGLGIGGIRSTQGKAWYVAGKNVATNTLIVVQGHNHPLLFSRSLTATKMSWVSGQCPKLPLTCTAKTRYRQIDQACTVEQISELNWQITFMQAQRAITPGQSVVFYQGEICLGGGIIDSTDQSIKETL